MDEQVETDTSDDANSMIGDVDSMPKPTEPAAESLAPSDFVEQPLDEATQQQLIEHGQRAEAAVSALSASLVLDQNRPVGAAVASAPESSDALPAGSTTDIVSAYASAFVSTSSAALTSLSTSIGSFLSSASSSIAGIDFVFPVFRFGNFTLKIFRFNFSRQDAGSERCGCCCGGWSARSDQQLCTQSCVGMG
jgi:hypothetical protein